MFQFHKLDGFLYVVDFLFLASLATIIIKLKLEKSSQGFSAKTQGVYGVVLCTRNIDLLFVEGSALYLTYTIFKKVTNISCIIYIVFKIKSTSKNNTSCNCNQDSFWVEALVIPCIIITAALHYEASPEEVLWSFSTYLEAVAMVPQLYLIHVRGKGDSYLPAYIALMASYTFIDALAFCLNAFIYENMGPIWPACKCVQLAIYIWYFFIPRESVMPVANCEERQRKTTFFMRQQSMLAQTLLTKNNSSNDLQVFSITSPKGSPAISLCGSSDSASLDGGFDTVSTKDHRTPPPTPCIKFDVGLESESIRLKAPITLNTIKQLKNKGTLKLSSLPSSPDLPRKKDLLRSTSTMDFFRPKNEFMQFDTATSQRAKRMKRAGISLPTTPESERAPSNFSFVPPLNRSISQVHLSSKLNKKLNTINPSDTSFPQTPELSRKTELVLRIHSLSSKSLSRLPTMYNRQRKILLKRPQLPTVEGSPAFIKKTDQINVEISPLARELTPSPKPERPPLPKILSESNYSDQKNPSNIPNTHNFIEEKYTPLDSLTTQQVQKPKRPPLPKLIISAPDVVD